MKKLSALIIALMTVCFANAASTLYFGELKIKPGDTQTIELNLQNEARLKGLELVLTLPTGLSFVYDAEEEEYVVGERCGWLSSNLRANGALKIAGAATKTKDYVAVGDGALFSVKVKADQNATLGTGNITISEVEIVTEASTENPDASQFPIKIYQEFTVTASSASETMGSVAGGGTYESGTNATLTATANTGYEFVKWSNDVTDNPYTFEVTSDVTLTAMFQAITYAITYNLNGGSLTTDKNSYTIDTETFTLDTPTRTGYDFGGWFDNADFTGDAITQIAKGTIGAKTFYAKWTPTVYTITYDLAGGAVATENPTEYTIESEAITLNNPTREGYDFAGWTVTGLDAANTTVTIAKGSTGNRSYTATWTPIVYTISYDLAGGAVATENPTEYTIESEAITLNNPTREGYDFAGWTGIGLDAATMTVTIAKGSTGNRSYTATWNVKQFTMTFIFGGNGQENAVITQDYGTQLIAPTPNDWTGHTFKGWSPEVPATIPAENKTFTAQWEVNKYKLTFKVDGEVYKQYELEYQATTTTPEDPVKEGHTFTGWDQEIPTTMPANDVTINAQFSINQYTMTFKFGESGQTDVIIKDDYGKALTAPTPDEWIGHTFSGWSPSVPTTIPAQDMTFNAVWDVAKYKLTFMVDGQIYKQEEVPYGAQITVPSDPSKEGYTFKGWDKEIPATMPAEDLTFNAQFNINQYKMTFVFGGNGQENVEITQDYGTTLTAPTVNEWTGHTFKAWSPEVPATIPAEDKTFTAQWDVNKYKLTFKVDGEVYKQYEVEYEAATTTPEDPTKEGHTFTGWDGEIPAKMPANDLTFNAQFSVNEYDIIYIVKGQEWARDKVAFGTTIELREYTPEAGEVFNGWVSDQEYTTMPAHDITYTANISTETGILRILKNSDSADVYTLTGLLVGRKMSATDILKLDKGIYVINGVKVTIQ